MIRFLIPLFVLTSLALFLVPGRLSAGDGGALAAPRREFRQSGAYPYTFVPVSYLETGGPNRMRFAQAEAECAHRDAPALPTPVPTPDTPRAIKASEDTDTSTSTSTSTVTSTATAATTPMPAPVAPAFPPPANAPAAGSPDLTKMPDEVMSYFKNPYNSAPRGPHLFDPIFEPGYHEGPKSKASYDVTNKP